MVDIKQVGGAGGFDRVDRSRSGGAGEKARQTDNTTRANSAGSARGDSAQISATGRETLQAVEALSERVRGDDSSREARVADVQARLERGDLDDPAVFRATADRLLRGGF